MKETKLLKYVFKTESNFGSAGNRFHLVVPGKTFCEWSVMMYCLNNGNAKDPMSSGLTAILNEKWSWT